MAWRVTVHGKPATLVPEAKTDERVGSRRTCGEGEDV
jgi:hypothetical protein